MPEHERSLLWSDPALAIDWPLSGLGSVRDDLRALQPDQEKAQRSFPLLSAKDAAAKTLAQLSKDGDLPDA
jgi:dTDP-4-dehydrorhamnose 3,5-epimerase-like enzyme